jgi:hypothetical protein
MESSPGCWATYGEVLAREYTEVAFAAAHRLTVDSYAVQHPGQPSPQSIQSVGLHLISLSLVLDHGSSMQQATEALQRGSLSKDILVWLHPPEDLGGITVVDVRAVDSAEAHIERVWDWARAAWAAWSQHSDTIEAWIRQMSLLPARAG